ncbi:topology modulation protein [Halobacillus halophilus]|uniref:topology modulation protein n=1 Tax=Halobacillus halophilus TaxID=1570 RepID=UPI001CD29B86|nr:topology modulation protein [Halobacillus halophilus]MCA1012506.1 topology modulation protein [Halobacillus halophilus]
MKRIMVMGISAGAGKSTFARQLGDQLNIRVYHLDAFYWKPGWIEAGFPEFKSKQEEVVERDSWIIEGNYSSTYDLRASHADTIIYLELPLLLCLYRVIKRWWLHRGKTRADMGEGCEEKLDLEFIKFIVTTYHPRKKKMKKRLEAFQSMSPDKKIIALKSRKEIRDFLKCVDSEG